MSQACASAMRVAGGGAPRAIAICWPIAFMNIAALLVFIVPKSA